jgi:hypothetical protein
MVSSGTTAATSDTSTSERHLGAERPQHAVMGEDHGAVEAEGEADRAGEAGPVPA